MNILSDRINNLSESATLEMSRKSRELKALGHDVINLSIGEPDFNTPEIVKEAGVAAINNNQTHYTPVSGIQDLRKAISDKFRNENGLDYAPGQIVVSNGAKQSIANAFLCLINRDDEVLVPAPYWVSYPEMVKLAEGIVIEIPTTIAQDFKVSPEQIEAAITPKTKAIIFSSPCNPTGSVYSVEELEAIAKVIAAHPNVFIISDEIYEYINYNGKHESIAQFDFIKDRVITINGVSKGYAMTGWRIGYMAASHVIASACNTLQGQTTSGPCSVSQLASLNAIQNLSHNSGEIITMLRAFEERKLLVLDKLAEIPGIEANNPNGAFYVFPHIQHYIGMSNGEAEIKSDNDLCLYLLEKAHVAAVPGSAFGSPGYMRISYATSSENLVEALKRIKEALSKLS
jgi:aspartate aminotransferase